MRPESIGLLQERYADVARLDNYLKYILSRALELPQDASWQQIKNAESKRDDLREKYAKVLNLGKDADWNAIETELERQILSQMSIQKGKSH